MESGREERLALHRRVQAFIRASSAGGASEESFDALALAIAAYQAEHVPAYARLLAARGTHPRDVAGVRALPAVPTDAFRFARIAAHPPSLDRVVFRTSGTTMSARGEHPLSTTETYEHAALAWGRWALFFDEPKLVALTLAPPPDAPGESSLEFMMRLFAERFAVRAEYAQRARGAPIEKDEVVRACEAAVKEGAAVVLMGTSFAFVHALDVLAGARLALPPGSRAMHTGGFKGRSREVLPDVLRGDIAATFGLETDAVVGEYGMTELSSQLYEGTLRASRGAAAIASRHCAFLPPPWLRVVACDAETLEPLPDDHAGILRFEDLGNVDGAIAVQTADRGRCRAGAVELLGRSPGAPPRGCSLAVEELLGR
jgi:hypothetical protein